ncbi:hypothetical protein Tco_0454257, partial [Tanacetum coccineum]
SENQANHHAGQQEANQNAGTEDIIDAGDSEKEDESTQDCFLKREEEQVFMDELERLKRQEKEANEEAEALRKQFAQETENLIIQEGAAKPSSTNIFSTVSTPAKASSTNFVNTVSIPVSTASPHEGLSLADPTNPKEDDSEIPPLEDIYQNSTDGIFTTSSYDDEGAVADFTNLETVVNVSPIPTSRIHSSHPTTLILGDPTSAVQTRSKVTDQAKEIQHLKAQIKKLKKQAKPVIHQHRAWLKSVSLKQRLTRKSFPKKQRTHKESVSKQGRKFAKGESSVQRDPLFDELPEDTVDHMETENAQDEGRTRDIVDEDKEIEENVLSTEDVLSTDKEKVSTDRPIVSTDGSKVSTDRQIEGTDEHIEGTDEQVEGTEEHNEGTEKHIEGTDEHIESTDGQRKGTEDHTEGSATQATQTPTSTIFGDDETIAKVLLNMSQAKAVSREKEKGVELKDIEEADRPRPTSTRSLLTLKPLPKIDPKDKGKKKIEEEDESESESDGIPEAEKKFKQLESDEEMARKIQEEWEGEEERTE